MVRFGRSLSSLLERFTVGSCPANIDGSQTLFAFRWSQFLSDQFFNMEVSVSNDEKALRAI